ncbi:hypothetical protein AB6A40_010716 [Gnathostoma spinigerum]|uniref:Cellular-myelocytomatosis proto-oncogene n=1 Tax=Gnathostoma spinigerum TaxID=75299 RepID=A0ABD6F385_9BILA
MNDRKQQAVRKTARLNDPKAVGIPPCLIFNPPSLHLSQASASTPSLVKSSPILEQLRTFMPKIAAANEKLFEPGHLQDESCGIEIVQCYSESSDSDSSDQEEQIMSSDDEKQTQDPPLHFIPCKTLVMSSSPVENAKSEGPYVEMNICLFKSDIDDITTDETDDSELPNGFSQKRSADEGPVKDPAVSVDILRRKRSKIIVEMEN